MWSTLRKQLRVAVPFFAIICLIQVAYPLIVTLIAQITMPYQANGSLVYVDGRLVGSELLGQEFTSPGYFHGRPSVTGYNGGESAGSNLGPSSAKLMEQVKQRIENVRQENNLPTNVPIPADLVLTSASGLDPDISVESAILQVSRVAKARGLAETNVTSLVQDHITYPQFGVLGTRRINVLMLNIALDELAKSSPASLPH
jgi:K+-transporting ATPase ATPase C chain